MDTMDTSLVAYEEADERVVPWSRNGGRHGHPESPEGH